MTEIRSWVTGVLAAVTVAIALGAGVQIARADVAEPAAVVVQAPSSATATSAPATATSAPEPTTTAPVRTTAPVQTTTKAPRTTSTTRTTTSVDTSRCTNRIDYSDDPRDNATINSIGADTGTCPAPIRSGDRSLVGNDRSMRDANGETYAEACRRMGYEPGPSCPAG